MLFTVGMTGMLNTEGGIVFRGLKKAAEFPKEFVDEAAPTMPSRCMAAPGMGPPRGSFRGLLAPGESTGDNAVNLTGFLTGLWWPLAGFRQTGRGCNRATHGFGGPGKFEGFQNHIPHDILYLARDIFRDRISSQRIDRL